MRQHVGPPFEYEDDNNASHAQMKIRKKAAAAAAAAAEAKKVSLKQVLVSWAPSLKCMTLSFSFSPQSGLVSMTLIPYRLFCVTPACHYRIFDRDLVTGTNSHC